MLGDGYSLACLLGQPDRKMVMLHLPRFVNSLRGPARLSNALSLSHSSLWKSRTTVL